MVDYGSTGRIMKDISEALKDEGEQSFTFSMKWKNNKNTKNNQHFYFGYYLENAFHQLLGKCFGTGGLYSFFGTKQLIRKIKHIKPDIVHFHNLHNCYIDFPLIFRFLNKNHIKIIITMHDCWMITGKCPHFLFSKCEKWKQECGNCPALNDYPKSKFDNTKRMLAIKKNVFLKRNIFIVSPSVWLSKIVNQSFLSNNKIKVINNGIDLKVFKPIQNPLNKNHLDRKKKIVLGVASNWTKQKGIDVFIELSTKLDSELYQIVLVGNIDDSFAIQNTNIIHIPSITNKEDLVDIYSLSFIFLNPTLEDTFPTVNMEANACGLPVITFNTGGCKETIEENSGICLTDKSVEAIIEAIKEIENNNTFYKNNSILASYKHSKDKTVEKYIEFYKEVLKK